MRLFNTQVFDDVIKGTDATWYSSSELNGMLGSAEGLVVQACPTGVVGSTALTVQLETSADNRNWIEAGSALVSTTVDNDASYVGRSTLLDLLAFTRLKITLGGASDECRLKLYATGRVLAGQ